MSHKVEAFVHSQHTHLQYTPLDIHCTNPAERAIQTWKNHFLSRITGLPMSFPVANWCRLTTQCNATLNMLCPCHQNPLLSTHEALKGSFSFDTTPMAPLGTEVLVHMKPHQHKTWGYHAAKAWYLAYAAQHYYCICVVMADTGGEHITDTFCFCHHTIPVPTITTTDRILHETAHTSLTPLQAYRKLPRTNWKPSKPCARYSLMKPLQPNDLTPPWSLTAPNHHCTYRSRQPPSPSNHHANSPYSTKPHGNPHQQNGQ